ncbi:DUF2019 domain-containing protein [Undibacter mobilis]|uniref:DUF2019 domain-containing protein n=1 Tax=Undibacter mobilis TaxID=2292256 RepID=A0A371B3P9_9BRAD|nr:DUF2019 domain-containing protein [Undibacter mobilis]RDV02154.1 DUF2019 domain-containing protein [Undibacter mobilis]
MKPVDLKSMSVAMLVQRFTDLCLGQYEAELRGELAQENRLIREMFAVREELKARPGDQRTALLSLYDHPNAQVRLMAATETLAVAPEEARRMLEIIRATEPPPQGPDAGMCLWTLDQGIFKPS